MLTLGFKAHFSSFDLRYTLLERWYGIISIPLMTGNSLYLIQNIVIHFLRKDNFEITLILVVFNYLKQMVFMYFFYYLLLSLFTETYTFLFI